MEICLALLVAVFVVTVVVYFTTRKKDSIADAEITIPNTKPYVDASRYVKVSVSPNGKYSGGIDAPSYTRQPIMIAEIELADEIEELKVSVAFEYTYVSGFKDGAAIVQKGETSRNVTLSKTNNKVALMCEPSLSIKVISITKQ